MLALDIGGLEQRLNISLYNAVTLRDWSALRRKQEAEAEIDQTKHLVFSMRPMASMKLYPFQIKTVYRNSSPTPGSRALRSWPPLTPRLLK